MVMANVHVWQWQNMVKSLLLAVTFGMWQNFVMRME